MPEPTSVCNRSGRAPKLFPVLYGLWRYYNTRGKVVWPERRVNN